MRLLNKVERGFFNACRAFVKIKGFIASPTVVCMLSRIIEKLTQTPRVQALKRGLERAKEMLVLFESSGVFNWAPRAREWLMDEDFILYLGFMSLHEQSRRFGLRGTRGIGR
jgi:hypothetical protein